MTEEESKHMTGCSPTLATAVEAFHGSIKLERLKNMMVKLSIGFESCPADKC